MNEKLCPKCGLAFKIGKLSCGRRACVRARRQVKESKRTHAPATRGAISEALACAFFLEQGYEVFKAVSPSCSADLLLRTKDGAILSIEVRTGFRLKDGSPSWLKKPSDNASHYAVVIGADIILVLK